MILIADIFQWVFYALGLLFMVLVIRSFFIKSILFNKKWKATVVYGVYGIIYFTLWFYMLNLQ